MSKPERLGRAWKLLRRVRGRTGRLLYAPGVSQSWVEITPRSSWDLRYE